MAKITRTSNAEQLRRAIEDIQRKRVNVGWFETQRYEDGTTVAYVASIQEFGWGPIPARPFLRPTIAEQRDAWRATLAKGSKRVLEGKMEMHQMLLAFGLSAAGQVAESIKAVTAPPLSSITLLLRQRRKSGDTITGKSVGGAALASRFLPEQGAAASLGVSDKPLVDTGQMLQSVTAQVSDK